VRTPLYGYHASKGHIVEFAGYDMPLWYEGIIPEVMAVREGVGIFDVSHMCRLRVSGADAEGLLNKVGTADASLVAPLQAKYSMLCNEEGGTIEDFIMIRESGSSFIFIGNAANRRRDMEWLRANRGSFDAEITDFTDSSIMIAVQGPLSQAVLQKVTEVNLAKVRRFRSAKGKVAGEEALLSRTGYTGEDGFEMIFEEVSGAEEVWGRIIAEGAAPVGLGARDVLRIEAGMPLYGNELDETTNPIEAGLGFAVSLEKHSFIGRETLLKLVGSEAAKGRGGRHRIGIRMLERAIPRKGFKLATGGREIGEVTSGTYSPTVGAAIAMAYARADISEGDEVLVDIRGRGSRATISGMPFYDTGRYGWRRRTI